MTKGYIKSERSKTKKILITQRKLKNMQWKIDDNVHLFQTVSPMAEVNQPR